MFFLKLIYIERERDIAARGLGGYMAKSFKLSLRLTYRLIEWYIVLNFAAKKRFRIIYCIQKNDYQKILPVI